MAFVFAILWTFTPAVIVKQVWQRSQEILHPFQFMDHYIKSVFSYNLHDGRTIFNLTCRLEKVILKSFISLFILLALSTSLCSSLLSDSSPVKPRFLSQKYKYFSCSFFPFQQQLKEKMSPHYSPSPAESSVDILPVWGRLFKNTKLIIPWPSDLYCDPLQEEAALRLQSKGLKSRAHCNWLNKWYPRW